MAAFGSWEPNADVVRATLRPGNFFGSLVACNFALQLALHVERAFTALYVLVLMIITNQQILPLCSL
jgi:hypothetical protein